MKGKLDGTSLRVPVPDGSITDFVGVLRTRRHRRGDQRGLPGRGHQRAAAERAGLQRRPAGLDRHRRLAGVVHLRLRAHHGHGQPGQDPRLVRQRVGLLQPPGRPGRDRRAPPTSDASPSSRTSATSTAARVLLRADFNVPIDDGAHHRRPAHPRRAAHHRVAAAATGRTVTACTHLGRPKGAPDPSTRWSRCGPRLAELAPGVELLENLRFDPGETANDPAFVAAPDRGPGRSTSTTPSGRRTGPTPRSSGPPQFLPSAAGRLLAREVEVLLPLRDDPAAAVRGDARRVQGERQARRDRGPARGGRPAHHRRRHVLHLPGRPGPPHRRQPARGRPGRDRAGACSTRARRITLPHDITALGPGGKIGDPTAGGEVRQLGVETCPTGGWASTSGPARPPSSPT